MHISPRSLEAALEPARGELAFSVLQARNLEKEGLWGKADPYVVLKLGEQRAKSSTVGNTQVVPSYSQVMFSKDPTWNFTAKLTIDETSPRHLLLEVYDSDLGKVSAPTCSF